MLETIPYWENISTNTKHGRCIDKIEKNTIEKAFNLIINKNCVLEIECEGGKWLDLAYNAGFSTLIGTDVNNYEKACKIKNENIIFYQVNPDESFLPCKDNSINLIIVMQVVPVVHSEWFYKEANRVLTKDGFVVGMITNKNTIRGFLFNKSRGKVEFRQNELSYTKSFNFWKKLIEKQNFKFFYKRGYNIGPFSRDSNSRLIPIFSFFENIFALYKLHFLSPWFIFILKKNN